MMMSNAARRKIRYLYKTERAAAGGLYLSIASSLSFYKCAHLSCMPTDRPLACSKETDSSMPTGQTIIIDDEDDIPDNWDDALYSCAQRWSEMTCTIDIVDHLNIKHKLFWIFCHCRLTPRLLRVHIARSRYLCRYGCGALFETDILIARKLVAKHMTHDHHFIPPHTWASQNDNNGRYSSPSRPMTMMSGVLESPWAALSIGRIVGLIGRLIANVSGQKGG